jgi:hypothetical protein
VSAPAAAAAAVAVRVRAPRATLGHDVVAAALDMPALRHLKGIRMTSAIKKRLANIAPRLIAKRPTWSGATAAAVCAIALNAGLRLSCKPGQCTLEQALQMAQEVGNVISLRRRGPAPSGDPSAPLTAGRISSALQDDTFVTRVPGGPTVQLVERVRAFADEIRRYYPAWNPATALDAAILGLRTAMAIECPVSETCTQKQVESVARKLPLTLTKPPPRVRPRASSAATAPIA